MVQSSGFKGQLGHMQIGTGSDEVDCPFVNKLTLCGLSGEVKAGHTFPLFCYLCLDLFFFLQLTFSPVTCLNPCPTFLYKWCVWACESHLLKVHVPSDPLSCPLWDSCCGCSVALWGYCSRTRPQRIYFAAAAAAESQLPAEHEWYTQPTCYHCTQSCCCFFY